MQYSDQQNEKFEADAEKLYDLWLTFIDGKTVGDEMGHLPPGLVSFCATIFSMTMEKIHAFEGGFALELTPQRIGVIIANVFEFGQFVFKQGVDVSDLTACSCGFTLTDDDIAKLLNARNN